MSSVFSTISLVAMILAAVALIVTITLWFALRIWEVIGDLRGHKRMAASGKDRQSSASERAARARKNRHNASQALNVSQASIVKPTMPLGRGETLPLGQNETAPTVQETMPLIQETEVLPEPKVKETELLGQTGNSDFEIIEDTEIIHTEDTIN